MTFRLAMCFRFFVESLGSVNVGLLKLNISPKYYTDSFCFYGIFRIAKLGFIDISTVR